MRIGFDISQTRIDEAESLGVTYHAFGPKYFFQHPPSLHKQVAPSFILDDIKRMIKKLFGLEKSLKKSQRVPKDSRREIHHHTRLKKRSKIYLNKLRTLF